MSRALDKDVLESLRKGDPRRVFNEISRIFDSPEEDGALLEIEFLGKAHPLPPETFFLRDGKDVGIPKLRLFQAFAAAYRSLKENLTGCSEHQALITEELRKATVVLLLADPEHLTAANYRKRAILQDLGDGEDAASCLRREKYFLDSILTSRLHRHTKSPTLWSHRRWLLDQFKRHGIEIDACADLRQVVFVSGERHPRNYYAWSHARWLLTTFVTREAAEASLHDMITDVQGWCLKHHDDISGWSFLHFLLSSRRGTKTSQQDTASAVFGSVIRMAESFRWRNESVWWFLHALAADDDDLLRQADLSLLEDVGGRMFSCFGSGEDEARLACKWFKTFEARRRLD